MYYKLKSGKGGLWRLLNKRKDSVDVIPVEGIKMPFEYSIEDFNRLFIEASE